MEFSWSATDPETGLIDHTERCTPAAEFLVRYGELTERGTGYLQIRAATQTYPLLALGLREGFVVVHVFQEDSVALLRGDGSVPSTRTVEVDILGQASPFTGDVLMCAERAKSILDEFLRLGYLSSPDIWSS